MVYVIQQDSSKIRLDPSGSILIPLESCLQTCMTYTIAVCTMKNSWWWTEELSETCRVSFQNKFEKLVHLLGFIIRKRQDSFNQQIKFQFKEETTEMLHLDHRFIWRGQSDTWDSRSEIRWKFWNVVLEKDGKDQLDRSCEKLKSTTMSRVERNILHTRRRRKANWTGHILGRNCLLERSLEGNIERRIEVKLKTRNNT
jgi:hypothetical protein